MLEPVIITIGDELPVFKERAKVSVMRHYVDLASADQRPATQRAMDSYKASEARMVAAGGFSELINREAALRFVSAETLAASVLREASRAEQIELDRVAASLAVDRAPDHIAIMDLLETKGITLY